MGWRTDEYVTELNKIRTKIDKIRIIRLLSKHSGSDWWPSGKQEERIKKECTGIKYQEWKGMVIPYQIWQGIILFFNSLQKREWKGMRGNYYSLWMVIFFRNIRECMIPRRSLVTIHTLNVSSSIRSWQYMKNMKRSNIFVFNLC